MSNVSSMVSSASTYQNSGVNQTASSDKAQQTKGTGKKSNVSGKTIGNPQISEKAAKYYESLKDKYSNMDFILVSKDQKEQAKANAAAYANPHKMVVLIDEEKIEKMASDENYRKQIEGVIAGSASGMSKLKEQVAASGANVKGFGMQVDDNGTAQYFAVLEKSSAAQKTRIEKNAAKKREAKKLEEKKAHKKEEQERLEKSRDKSDRIDKSDSSNKLNKTNKKNKEETETVTITASSVEELMQKIGDQNQLWMSDNVQTEAEKQVGQQFDFSV